MAIERLSRAMDVKAGDRYVILYGPCISDAFISQRYVEQNIEQALWELLREQGFERIAFISPQGGLYFLDADSRDHSREKTASVPPRRSKRGGPMGGHSMLKATPEAPSPKTGGRPVTDEGSISIANRMMRDETKRTAIVFTQAETLLRYFDSPRLLAGHVGGWTRLGTRNKNMSIWLFGGMFEDVAELLERAMPEMHTFLTTRSKGAGYNVSQVEPPDLAEMARLIDYVRLRDEVTVKWKASDQLLDRLSAEGKPVATWLPLFCNAGEFSMDAARKNQWVPVLPDGKSAMKRLDELVGLASVKEQVRNHIAFTEIMARRRQQGLIQTSQPPAMHMVFTGNPGTGKTEVARLMGEILREIGMLRRGHLVEAGESSDLVAPYVGQTAIRTNQLIDTALDGVLFVDEAYRLTQTQNGSFGQEAVDAILTRMENDRDRLAVIVAGYPKEMHEFIKSNPGLNRRFTHRIDFPDYTPDELMEILSGMMRKRGMSWTDEMEAALQETVEGLYALRTPEFGNAGEMRNLAEALEQSWSVRVAREALPVDSQLIPDDVPGKYAEARQQGRDQKKERTQKDIMSELDGLVGLTGVKEHIRRLYNRLLLDERKRAKGLVSQPRSLHLVFTGNPGTGKTTVARLIGEIYRRLGLLRRGHLVEVDTPAKLIGEYVGRTAVQTNEVVDRALDGLLFIDEAYQFADTSRGGFVNEARDTLMSRMDNERNRLAVILAGYPDEMERLLDSNPGLRSRTSEIIHFPDYDEDELIEILSRMVQQSGYRISEAALAQARAFLRHELETNPKSFGNARSVRNLFEKMQNRMADRVVNSGEDLDLDSLCLEAPDVPPFVQESSNVTPPMTESRFNLLTELVPAPTRIDMDTISTGVVFISIVTSKGEKGSGTGFIVTPAGHVLTVAHLVENARRIEVRLEAGQPLPATVLGYDRTADIAVLALPQRETPYPWLPLAAPNRRVQKGVPVMVLSYPLGEELGDEEASLSEGIVSATRTREGVKFLQISANVTHGSSGAPVLSRRDKRVIGIIHGGVRPELGASLNLGVHIGEVYLRFSEKDAYESTEIHSHLQGA